MQALIAVVAAAEGKHWLDYAVGVVQAISLGFLIVYVRETAKMAAATRAAVEEQKTARLEAMAPRIVISFAPVVDLMEIVVENVGSGTAKDVRFTFDPPLQGSGGQSAERFFSTPKPYIPPGYKLTFGLDSWYQYLAAKPQLPRCYRVGISYTGRENEKPDEYEMTLDVDAMAHLVSFDRKEMHDLVQEVERGHKALGRSLEAIRRTIIDIAEDGRDGGDR